jgi:ribosomal protein S27E
VTSELEVLNEILDDKKVERVFEDGHAPDNIVCGSHPGIKGAKQVKCSSCRAILWVSPKGQVMIAKHPQAAILCVRCAKQMVEDLKGPAA